MKKLDLHRTRHDDAKRNVIRFIEDNWGSKEEAEIITGNSQRMKNIVMKVLQEYGLDYQIGRIFDVNNQGYIVVWFE